MTMMGKVLRMEPNRAVIRLELSFPALLSVFAYQPGKPIVIIATKILLVRQDHRI